MTPDDYEAIAQAIARTRWWEIEDTRIAAAEEAAALIVDELCDLFEEHDTAFDRKQFARICGFKGILRRW